MTLADLDKYMDIAVTYLKIGADYVAQYMMTVEGVIVMVFVTFVLGLFSMILNS